MAAGLAEQIMDKFGVMVELVEGHDGIYEVWLNKTPVYSNRGACSGIKSATEILWIIGRQIPLLPGKKLMTPLMSL
jgi:hypothetical protein